MNMPAEASPGTTRRPRASPKSAQWGSSIKDRTPATATTVAEPVLPFGTHHTSPQGVIDRAWGIPLSTVVHTDNDNSANRFQMIETFTIWNSKRYTGREMPLAAIAVGTDTVDQPAGEVTTPQREEQKRTSSSGILGRPVAPEQKPETINQSIKHISAHFFDLLSQ